MSLRFHHVLRSFQFRGLSETGWDARKRWRKETVDVQAEKELIESLGSWRRSGGSHRAQSTSDFGWMNPLFTEAGS